MKILGLVNRASGPSFHRILNPLVMMQGIDAYITNNVKPEDFDGAEWVYYNRVVNKELLTICKEKGVRIAVDVDDYWKLDKHHIAYDQYQDSNFEFEQTMHILNADVVTTTHERLADLIYPINKNVIITPNAIPKNKYFEFERTEAELTRIFWQGSITHENDLKLLQPSIRRIDGKKNAMILAGFTDNPIWHRMAKIYTRNMELPGAVLPAKDVFNYYENYGVADIAVCPLIESRFNQQKSNLKVLEAANAGVPVICSNVHPYKDLPVLYANNALDWLKHINDLTNDLAMRKETGASLKRYCEKHYNFEKINKLRLDAFKINSYETAEH